MATDMRAKLVVEAQTSGNEQIAKLGDELEQMGREGAQAAPRFQLLAAELRALSQQQGLIDQFTRLKAQTASYAQAAEQAQAATRQSALAYKALQQAQRQAQDAERAATTQLQAARQAHQQTGQALQAARLELRQLGAASKQAGADTAVLADRMGDVRAQVKVLQGTYRDAGAEVKTLAAEQRQAAQSVRQIGADARAAEAAFDRHRSAAAAANKTYQDGQIGLQRLRDEMAGAGVSSDNLAQAQIRVRREVDGVRQSAERSGVAWEQAASKAQAAATHAQIFNHSISA